MTSKLTPSDFLALSEIAIRAARAAGGIIQSYRRQDVHVEQKADGHSYASQVVTEVDRACETAILNHLLPTCAAYDLALLSEETEDDGSRFRQPFFWCVDPMDGTLAFIERRPGFSVSIALVRQDGTPCLGVVFDPSTDTLYHAIRGAGAYKNGQAWKAKPLNPYLTYVTDRRLQDTPRATEIEALLRTYAARLGLTEIKELPGGGAVLNAMRVLENGPACMLKMPKNEKGGGSTWDYAATACIFHELGLPATDFAGQPLKLNRRDGTFMNREGMFYGNLEETD